MKQVDFYLISNRVNNAKFKLASRLANKLQRLGQRSLVVTDNEPSTTLLDQIMWSFSDASFLAHDGLTNATTESKVVVGEHSAIEQALLDQAFDVLINLASEVPVYSHHFERVAEIVEAEDEAKSAARTRYKRYQSEGFEIKTHDIEL